MTISGATTKHIRNNAYGTHSCFLEKRNVLISVSFCFRLFLKFKVDLILWNHKADKVIHIPEIFIVNNEVFLILRTDYIAVVVSFLDQVNDMTGYDTFLLIITHRNIIRLDR